MVKNHHLAKSISDAAWYRFREWLEYFGKVYGVPVIAVEPGYTSQDCSNCGKKVLKTLSTRTHRCPHCGYVADRDLANATLREHNAAINILKSALKQLSNTVGQTEIQDTALAGSPTLASVRYASGEIGHYLSGETLSSKPARRNRKRKTKS